MSLGCAKNLVDGEYMSSHLKQEGFHMTRNPDEAHVAIVNTCGFIDAAKAESIDKILEMAELKNTANLELLIASGCMSERYTEEMQVSLPEVDVLLGVRNYKDIAQAIYNYYDEETIANEEEQFLSRIYKSRNREDVFGHVRGEHVPSTRHYAYLKIAEGCSNHCSFCAIPGIRGPFQSRPLEDILQEARDLTEQGYDELIVIAQDSGFYGLDIYKERKLADLLDNLEDIPNLKWIKVLYLYAEGLTDKLMDVFKRSKKLIPYFDIPVQHASDEILQSMNRKDNQATLRSKIMRIRQELPQAIIRTTVMVGYPGETEKDFQELLSFIEDIRFERLGCFTYSPEEGTKAYNLDNQVDEKTKQKRFEILMETQRKISNEHLEKRLHQTMEVKIDSISDDGIYYLARSAYEVPEVDPEIYVLNPSEEELIIGQYYDVHIIETDDYELTGVIQ